MHGPYSYDVAPAELFFAAFKSRDINPSNVPMGKSHFDNVVQLTVARCLEIRKEHLILNWCHCMLYVFRYLTFYRLWRIWPRASLPTLPLIETRLMPLRSPSYSVCLDVCVLTNNLKWFTRTISSSFPSLSFWLPAYLSMCLTHSIALWSEELEICLKTSGHVQN